MECSVIGIEDLPDEIIMKIWNKLSKIDVIYSFMGVNKRFNKLVRDPVYTRSLEFIKTNHLHALSNIMIDRYCSDILPKIHHLIEHLTIEPLYMERILRCVDYPRLCKLTFTTMRQDLAQRYFTGKIFFVFLFSKCNNQFMYGKF